MTLGEIADIQSDDPQQNRQLAELELVLAPAKGTKRFLRSREVQDLLMARGVNLAVHHFSGAREIQIGVDVEDKVPTAPIAVPTDQEARLSTAVKTAIAQYLDSSGDPGQRWYIEVDLSEVLPQLATASHILEITGGQRPWTGRQQFALLLSTEQGEVRVPVAAEISILQPRVVAIRELRRGAIIRESDVELRHEPATYIAQRAADGFKSVDQVVGQEVRRPIRVGQSVDRGDVQRPVLVHRGDEVTVFARTGGIQVSTRAVARDDGSHGELVEVETLIDRTKIYARVSGPQTVDIFARSASTASPEVVRP